MNGIVRSVMRVSALRGMLKKSSTVTDQHTRALWNMCESRQTVEIIPFVSSFKLHDFHSRRCYSRSHTKAEKELVEFLAEEIMAEKKAQKLNTIPTTLDEFTISFFFIVSQNF